MPSLPMVDVYVVLGRGLVAGVWLLISSVLELRELVAGQVARKPVPRLPAKTYAREERMALGARCGCPA